MGLVVLILVLVPKDFKLFWHGVPADVSACTFVWFFFLLLFFLNGSSTEPGDKSWYAEVKVYRECAQER